MARQAVVVAGTTARFEQLVTAGPHRFTSDEPAAVGGADAGPTPYDLLLAALGSCTSMTVAAYARRKQWPLLQVTVELEHERVHAEDCAAPDDGSCRLQRIRSRITLAGPLDDAQRARLLEIADRCPVHKTLTGELEIETSLVEPAGQP